MGRQAGWERRIYLIPEGPGVGVWIEAWEIELQVLPSLDPQRRGTGDLVGEGGGLSRGQRWVSSDSRGRGAQVWP